MMTEPKTSTIPDVKAYLLRVITERVNDAHFSAPDVTVTIAGMETPEVEDDAIVIGRKVTRTVDAHRMVGGGGPHWLRESYQVSVHIECVAAAEAEFATVEARALVLLGIVDNAVRADPSLGGLVIRAKPGASDIDSEYEPDHSGAMCNIDMAIDVLAEL